MPPGEAVGPALWFGSNHDDVNNSPGDDVAELAPDELRKSGSPQPVTIVENELTGVMGVAFDPSGNLWVTDQPHSDVYEFTKHQLQQLKSDPTPTPAAHITSSSEFGFVLGCTFDAAGNLWLADNKGKVHELSASQLAAGSGNVTPAMTITASAFNEPAFVLFDTAGNLWVSSNNNNELVQIAASDLSSGGSKTPSVIISGSGVNSPGEMQIDKLGTLWVANAGNNTISGFTADQITSTGSPAPNIVISDDGNQSLNVPFGMALDRNGSLWVFNYVGNQGQKANTATISKFSNAQLQSSGSPTPDVFLQGFPLYAGELTFGPVHRGQ